MCRFRFVCQRFVTIRISGFMSAFSLTMPSAFGSFNAAVLFAPCVYSVCDDYHILHTIPFTCISRHEMFFLHSPYGHSNRLHRLQRSFLKAWSCCNHPPLTLPASSSAGLIILHNGMSAFRYRSTECRTYLHPLQSGVPPGSLSGPCANMAERQEQVIVCIKAQFSMYS